MSAIGIENLTKTFGAEPVVDGVSLDTRQGEFLALLGPSGCGKTTLLRMIAGFESPNAGRILFDGRPVAGGGIDVPPEKRNVAIVFQSYALWPHMSVGENVGYPLRVRGLRGAARAARVAEALAAVELSGFEGRRPADLSGGQRQRVALARCLAMEPSVVLLDEPLANLDVHLRASMEETFSAFHRRTEATMVYVTHDQAEAMAMADRIAVMDRGRLLQVSPPAELYAEPADETVARFVGHGRVVSCETEGREGEGRMRVRLFGAAGSVRARDAVPGSRGRLCLRAEDLSLGEGFAATVRAARFTGSRAVLTVSPESAPEEVLTVAHAVPVEPGTKVSVRVADGWLIPEARGAAARAA